MRQKTSIQIFNYWNEIRGQKAAPMRTQIDPARVRHILPDLFILDVSPAGIPQFRLAGTRVCDLFSRDLRGAAFSSLWAAAQREDPETLSHGVMMHSVCALINVTGYTSAGQSVAFEMILMPVRSTDERSDRILGAIAPAAQASWLGIEPIEFLALDRSRLLSDETIVPAVAEEKPVSLHRSYLREKGFEFGQALSRVMHLKIFESHNRPR